MITRQYRVGPWLGAFKMQSSRAMFYLSFPQTPMVAIAATPQLQKWFPWMSFWWVILFFALYFILIGMWLDYKFMLPSEMAYNNKQAYMHENPYVRDMAQAQKDISAIKEQLTRIEGLLTK